MPLWLTALVLVVLWFTAYVIRQTIVPFPPWAFEVGTIAMALQFLFYTLGSMFEIGSHSVRKRVGLSWSLHRLSLSIFLGGGIALYCLVGDVLGMASLWALYVLCRALKRSQP